MQIEIDTGALLVRRFTGQDVDPLYEAIIESLPELSCWMWWAHESYAKSETATFIKSQQNPECEGDEVGFGIFEKNSGLILGCAGLNRIDRTNKCCNLGYWVRSSATGRGIATTVARRLAAFALTELGMNRVEVIVAAENVASLRVAEKIGAKREGIARCRLTVGETVHDAWVHSIVRSDLSYEARRGMGILPM
jgi:RimJ/RimL family protein N-acetyltransferase